MGLFGLSKRSRTLLIPVICFYFFSTTFFLTNNTFVFASTESLSETVNIRVLVVQPTIAPAPPPAPNPISNNGVPLTVEAGVDTAIFKGLAYPGSSVLLLKNGLILHELPSNSDGTFEIPVRNILPGTYTFSLSAKDKSGLVSTPVTYTIIILSGIVTEVSNIIIPPTVTSNKIEVKQGDEIIFSGKAISGSEVIFTLFANEGITKSVTASSSGDWSYSFFTTQLAPANYNVKVRSKISNQHTLYSETVLFTVGTRNTFRKGGKKLVNARCDLNNDSRVNLLDFSIMAYWYKRLGFPMKVDLNSDGRISLTDLSILAYCWTG